MALFLKPVFDILTGDVAVCDNILYNYLILLFVGEVTLRCAFSLVGDTYCSGIIEGRVVGSILHWIIRLSIYLVIAYLLRVAIEVYNFIIAIPIWIWFTMCLLGIITAVFFIAIRKRKITIKN